MTKGILICHAFELHISRDQGWLFSTELNSANRFSEYLKTFKLLHAIKYQNVLCYL